MQINTLKDVSSNTCNTCIFKYSNMYTSKTGSCILQVQQPVSTVYTYNNYNKY